MTTQARSSAQSWKPGEWHYRDCYGCGAENPLGLHAKFPFHEESGEVRLEFTPLPEHQGAPGYVHGGVLSTLLDEAQGVLCHSVGHMVMTDRLNLKYHRATPVDRPFRIHARLTAVRKRRLYTRAELLNDADEVLVSSNAVFYMMPERLFRKMFSVGPDSLAHLKNELESNRRRAREIRLRLKSAVSESGAG